MKARKQTGTIRRLLLAIGACLPLFAAGCVAEVGNGTEATESSSAQLPKPVSHKDDGTSGGDPTSGGGGQPAPLTPQGGDNGNKPNPGGTNSDPHPSPWTGGSGGTGGTTADDNTDHHSWNSTR